MIHRRKALVLGNRGRYKGGVIIVRKTGLSTGFFISSAQTKLHTRFRKALKNETFGLQGN